MATPKKLCAACGDKIGHCTVESAVYRSFHLLCEPCGVEEDDIIEAQGTNDLPWLLAMYGQPPETKARYVA